MKTVFSTLLFFFILPAAYSQEADISRFIAAWKVSDRSQSHRAAVFLDEMDAKKDEAVYNSNLQALYAYMGRHKDIRIEARIYMYEAFGALVFQKPGEKYKPRLERAMEIAHELKDDQLLAEIYVLYAEIASGEYQPLYNIKAIELQERIGFKYFTTVHARFFIVSNALYHSQDYRQSINYGLRCLSFIHTDRKHWLKRVYNLQLDILGSAYKRLGKYDSTVYYYSRILDTLRADPDTGVLKDLWAGIAKGNIGHCYVLKGRYQEGIPLIEAYIASSKAAGFNFNVLMASSMLADAFNRQGQYAAALRAWQQAWQHGDTTEPEQYMVEAARGMADIYRKSGHTDSAFYYYDRYHSFVSYLNKRLDASRLSAIHARMASEKLQENLESSQAELSRSRTVLQVTIAGTLLLLIILLLLYNRYRLKSRHRLEMIRRKKEMAEAEIAGARKQIAGFTEHMIEKNSLIDQLQDQLKGNQELEQRQLTTEKLSEYMLVSEEEWEKFRLHFTKAYPPFFTKLRQLVPQITPAEERLSALIFLQLNNFQITKMLGIERDSVARARRRLKNRLQLDENDNLDEYLRNLLVINN